MKVYISDVKGYVGSNVAAAFLRDSPGATIVGSGQANVSVGSPSAIPLALESDVIVLNLLSALVESQAIVEALREYIAALPPLQTAEDEENGGEGEEADRKVFSKTIIVISSILCWDRTTSTPQPFEEAAYKRRRPGMKTAEVRDTEIAAVALARPDKGVRTHVIAAGLPYGGGWGPLYHFLRRAWLCIDNGSSVAPAIPVAMGLPVPCVRDERGKNKLATIHVKDLSSFVARVAANSAALQPEPLQGEYLLAVDESTDTLVDILSAISRTLGCGGVKLLTKEQATAFFQRPYDKDYSSASIDDAPARVHIGTDSTLLESTQVHLASALTFDTGSASIFSDGRVALSDDVWHCRGGIVNHIDTVCKEFVRDHDLRPLRLAILGPPAVGKTHVSRAFGIKYQVPVVSAKEAIDWLRSGNLRALSDGSPERLAALTALRDAIDKAAGEHEAAVTAALAAAEKSKKKDSKKLKEEEPVPDRGFRLPRALFVRAIRALLLSPECRNKGWVLDGVPRTWFEADALFEVIPEDDDGITPSEEGIPEGGVLKEEADEDNRVIAEASQKQVAISVLGQSITNATTTAAPADDEEDAEEAAEEAEPPEKKEADARLRPTAALFLDAADEWLEAKSLAAGGGNRDRFLRRLKRARLHNSSQLSRTPLGWLETNARVDTCELRTDSILQLLEEGKMDSAGAGLDADASGNSALVAVKAARQHADVETDEDARIAALQQITKDQLLSPYVDVDPAKLVPSDLSGEQQQNALLDLGLLKAFSTFAHKGGRPANFHPFDEEKSGFAAVLQTRASQKEAAVKAEDSAAETEESDIVKQHLDLEAQRLAAAKRAEAVLLEERTAPLRAYLLERVIPHITAGLIDVCKAGPVDPVDHLADYLFKIAMEQEAKASHESKS